MESILRDKNARFAPFYIMFAVLGILLLGSFITPFRIVLDNIFNNIQNTADAEQAAGNPNYANLSCTDPSASGIMKATCFSLGGFMVIFVLYGLYYWISGMVAGAQSPTPVFSNRLNAISRSLEG